MLFKDLDIIKPIQEALTEAGYASPTPIQEKCIPTLLEGRDLLGCAQTGTGKTAAFAIPVLQNLVMNQDENEEKVNIKALILAPTRELAIQIEENFTMYSKNINIKNTVIFGGVSQKPQVKILRQGVDVLIATPGRLLDLINQGYIDLSFVKHFVLDEADRMFDMGMIHDVKRIISKLPKVRQNLLFSATMPKEVMKLVDNILKDPVKVEVAPVSSTIDTITQSVYFVEKKEKKFLLVHVLKDESIKSLLVFSRTKHGANNIVKILAKAGIEAAAIHGNKSQGARQRALSDFKEGRIRVLVATDIAARGIDIDGLSNVINYDLPDVPETYVHRIGRTGRAGKSGVAVTFCDSEEKKMLKDIEKVIKKSIPVMEEVEFEKVILSGESAAGSGEAQKDNNDKKNSKKLTSNEKRKNWFTDKKRREGRDGGQGKKRSSEGRNGQGRKKSSEGGNDQAVNRDFEGVNGQGRKKSNDKRNGQGVKKNFEGRNDNAGKREFEGRSSQGRKKNFDLTNGQAEKNNSSSRSGQSGKKNSFGEESESRNKAGFSGKGRKNKPEDKSGFGGQGKKRSTDERNGQGVKRDSADKAGFGGQGKKRSSENKAGFKNNERKKSFGNKSASVNKKNSVSRKISE